MFGRKALSFSTWFCIPEQKMKDLEILNRGSAVVIKAKNKNFKHKYHVITSSHIVAPWRWKNYYPEEWLQYLTEKNTHYTAELRQETGVYMLQFEMIPTVYHHPTRDLACLHFMYEESNMDTLSAFEITGEDLVLDHLKKGDELEIHGHHIGFTDENAGAFFSQEAVEEDVRVPIPRTVKGQYEFSTDHQTFARTEDLLTEGMCGGPVFVLHKKRIGNNEEKRILGVCGLVDGIVPDNHPNENIRGLASYVTSAEINQFLQDVEAGAVDAVTGGEAGMHVGQDQDKSKMDVEEILRKFSN